MEDSWRKIKNWLTDNYPEVIETLNDGASTQDITNLESTIGWKLPSDFKEFLSIHNGQEHTHLRLFDGDTLLSTTEIVREWTQWKDIMPVINTDCMEQFGVPSQSRPERGIKNDWWNAGWIPLTSNGSGDHYCIDLDPDIEGKIGQIIRMLHDHPDRELISPSFCQWITDYTIDLENGVYTTSDDIGWGGVVRKDL